MNLTPEQEAVVKNWLFAYLDEYYPYGAHQQAVNSLGEEGAEILYEAIGYLPREEQPWS